VAEMAEAITEYFLVKIGYLRKVLFIEHYFSTELRGMLFLVFSPTTSINVTSTLGTNEADNVVFDSALEFDCFFHMDSESLPKADKGTTKSTQQSKPIPKGSQSGLPKADEGTTNLLNNQNLFQKGVKVVSFFHQRKKLPAALQVHQGWDYIGAVLLNESEFSSKGDLLDNFLSARVNNYVTEVREQLRSKLRNNDLECNELNIFCFLLSSGLDYVMEYLNESLARKGLNKTITYMNFVIF
jgi:hypothetical protein